MGLCLYITVPRTKIITNLISNNTWRTGLAPGSLLKSCCRSFWSVWSCGSTLFRDVTSLTEPESSVAVEQLPIELRLKTNNSNFCLKELLDERWVITQRKIETFISHCECYTINDAFCVLWSLWMQTAVSVHSMAADVTGSLGHCKIKHLNWWLRL